MFVLTASRPAELSDRLLLEVLWVAMSRLQLSRSFRGRVRDEP